MAEDTTAEDATAEDTTAEEVVINEAPVPLAGPGNDGSGSGWMIGIIAVIVIVAAADIMYEVSKRKKA